MRVIKIGQPVVTRIEIMIEKGEVEWGYLLHADVETRKGIIQHAMKVDAYGNPLRVDVCLDDLVYIDV